MAVLRDYADMQVRLNDERWAHIEQHPEMRGMRDAVERTLRSPQFVVQSVSDADARLYYHYYTGTRVGDKFLCVVVKVVLDDAFVVTAYLTDKIKKGAILWSEKP